MKKKILLVDDDRVLLKYLTNVLEREGHQIETVEDGISALNRLTVSAPDVILLDLILPKIDGDKLCRVIRKMDHLKASYLVVISAAVAELEIDLDDFVFVSGIGCSAWIPSPFYNADTLHTTHGRPIAYATGVKLGLPDNHVMVVSGDGDLTAIGGNHLIHAARRNIDLTVVLVNNGIYAMTGGQTAPTTPRGLTTITSPHGTLEYSFDISAMIAAAGASFVARWTTYHPRQMTRSVKKGIQKKGFALIEAVSQCPVQYGRVMPGSRGLLLVS